MSIKPITPMPKVPSNIITGFLGVGKTSAILNLLEQKPQNERWAVLVNEFGEIGIDGALIKGQQDKSDAVFIKELPGGCMCCTNGLPMQIALNQLIAKAKPDRLLIEPTGLGHPVEVLETLSNEFNRQIIDIQQTLTLVDARKLDNPRYTKHETFIQQLSIADRILANKADAYGENEAQALTEYLHSLGLEQVPVEFIHQASIDSDWLIGPTRHQPNVPEPSQHSSDQYRNDQQSNDQHSHGAHSHKQHAYTGSSHVKTENKQENANDSAPTRVKKAENQGEGFESIGWTIPPTQVFSLSRLQAFFGGLNVERMKAVFITNEGIFGFNLADDVLSMFEISEAYESRIEIICEERNPNWEDALFQAVITH